MWNKGGIKWVLSCRKVYGVLRGIRGVIWVTSSDDSVGDVARDLFRVNPESPRWLDGVR